MKEIHYIVGTLEVGGAERHLSQVLPALKAKGFSLKIIVLSNKVTLGPIFKNAGIIVSKAPNFDFLPTVIRRPIAVITSVIRLFLDFLKNRKAIRHAFLPEAYLLTAFAARLAFFKGILVMSRRSLNHYQQRRPALGKLEKIFRRFTSFAMGNSLAVIKQLHEEGFSEKQIKLIYNGIELHHFQNLPSKAELRKSSEFDSKALIFVIVANLIHYKGHADLLNAFAKIQNDLPSNWMLLCVGKDSGILDSLEKQCLDLGIKDHVQFLGSRSDTAKILSASDVGILCSHEEGFSNAILEAMAAGLPMVVTNVGGNTEAVIDGTTGIVVEPKNPESLSAALLRFALSEELRDICGKLGKKRVNGDFTLEKCVEQYEDFYKNL